MFTGGGAGPRSTLLERAGCGPAHAVDGPAIIAEDCATTVVEPGWRAVRDRPRRPAADPRGRAAGPAPTSAPRSTRCMLEIFNNLFMSVAEQMGVRLQSTAHSVNIKERLDFSCAVFDADGGLIANAPHMPVHLGSMGESIKMVITRNARPASAAATSTCSTTPTTAAPTCPTSPWSPRCSTPTGDEHLVLRGQPRPPRRDRRDHARVHAGRQHPGRGGGGADRQLAAGRRTAAARGRDASSC